MSCPEKRHSEWAARRLVSTIRAHHSDPKEHLVQSEMWAYRILRERYLVQGKWIKHAYAKALSLAEGKEKTA
jgi:hypothetical protein